MAADESFSARKICDRLMDENLTEQYVGVKKFFGDILKNVLGPDESSSSSSFSTAFVGALDLLCRSFILLLDYLNIGIVGFLLTTVALYFFYTRGIRPYDYIQDLDLPGQTEKRRDIVNLMRRLRKIGKKLPPAYANGWYCVAESAEVQRGGVKQVDCLGENLAVFRTLDGQIHVSDAHCPHLGANMAVGGVAKDGCIECPFHKWRFDAVTGKCTSVPTIDTVPKGVEIKIWTSQEVNGGIHIWYDAEGRPPQWDVPSVDRIDSGEWVYHGRNEFLVASHMQDIPENGADVAHLNAIHADHLLAGKTLPTPVSWNFLGIHEWGGVWENGSAPHEAIVKLNHRIVFIPNLLSIFFTVTAIQIGPSYVLLKLKHRIGEVVFLQSILPLEPLLQKVVHRLYAPWYIRPLANLMMMGETIMFHRDVMIWNSKEFVYNPVLSKTDKCLKAFRKWFQQFYSDNSIPFKDAYLGPQREIIDW